jgi:ABC-type transport system involved in multi-copper enzyme maturation permease subunit
MMIVSEIKRILTKSPILVLILFIIPVFAISSIITGIKQPTPPPPPTDAQFADVTARLDSLRAMFQTHDDFYKQELYDAFKTFEEALYGYRSNCATANPQPTLLAKQHYFGLLNQAFIDFRDTVDTVFGSAPKVLMSSSNYSTLRRWIEKTEKHTFDDQYFHVTLLRNFEIDNSWFGISRAWEEYANHQTGELKDHRIYQIVANINPVTFTDAQKEKLEKIDEDKIQMYYIQFPLLGAERLDALEVSCEYLALHIKIMQSKNVNGIAKFQGFRTFNNAAARDRIAVLGKIMADGKTTYDFSAPFTFGAVINKTTGTTPQDFIFNNLELVTIPLIILAGLVVIFCIFDDIKKNTILAPLVSTQSRRKIILAKLFACAITIALVITVFSLLYFVTALALTGGGVSAPSVIIGFGGKAFTMPPTVLLFIYLFSLFFKLVFCASIVALFCINAKTLTGILVKSGPIVAFLILLNVFFSFVFSVAFYQYLPLLALDFAGYFGVGYMLSRHLFSVVIWYTLPIMLIALTAIIITTVVKFTKRDF